MPKFFVSDNQIKNDNIIEIIGEDVNHISNVLRLKNEDHIFICNKDTNITYDTKILEKLKEKVICQILDEIEETTEAKVDVTIFQGLPKAEKMEYIIQKATELGVKKIVPVAMKRCIVKLEGKDAIKKIDRWQKIAEVAAKQSGRDLIPKISEISKIDNIISEINNYDLFIVAYENEKDITLKQVLQELHKNKVDCEGLKIAIVIGPEGGLDDTEIEKFISNGAKVITLGNRILRTETASLAILSNIVYEYDL